MYDEPPELTIDQADKAVALYYDGETAPTITAQGESKLARDIIELATELEIPIYQNPQLVEQLGQLELGDEIPELLYRVIAEIIAFVYQLNGKEPSPVGHD